MQQRCKTGPKMNAPGENKGRSCGGSVRWSEGTVEDGLDWKTAKGHGCLASYWLQEIEWQKQKCSSKVVENLLELAAGSNQNA